MNHKHVQALCDGFDLMQFASFAQSDFVFVAVCVLEIFGKVEEMFFKGTRNRSQASCLFYFSCGKKWIDQTLTFLCYLQTDNAFAGNSSCSHGL